MEAAAVKIIEVACGQLARLLNDDSATVKCILSLDPSLSNVIFLVLCINAV